MSPRVDFAGDQTFDMGASGARGDGGGQTALFDRFVKSDGRDLFREFSQMKANLKEVKNRMRDCSAAVNEAKRDIDDFQREIEMRKASRIEMLKRSGLKASETEDIVDEDEFKLMKDLREAKRTYKNGYEQLQKLRSQLAGANLKVEESKSDLNNGYSAWCAASTRAFEATGFDVSGGSPNGGAATTTGRGGKFGKTSSAETGSENSDQLDDQEAFDRLEIQRVLSNDPDSLAFFHAQKTRRANLTQNSGTIRQMQKNKRFR